VSKFQQYIKFTAGLLSPICKYYPGYYIKKDN
jgi:hypothetical protein